MTNVMPPLLVLSGEVDIVTKPQAGEYIAKSSFGGSYQVIEGVNHMGFLERPDIYNSAIASFALSVQPFLTQTELK